MPKPHRILCVEDEIDLREDMVEALEEAGYEVAAAANGEEALVLLPKFDPSLVLSDVLMPVTNGFEMLRAIRRFYRRFANMPVIFLSAFAEPSEDEMSVMRGPQYYLKKPVEFDDLIDLIEELLADPQSKEIPDAVPEPVQE